MSEEGVCRTDPSTVGLLGKLQQIPKQNKNLSDVLCLLCITFLNIYVKFPCTKVFYLRSYLRKNINIRKVCLCMTLTKVVKKTVLDNKYI